MAQCFSAKKLKAGKKIKCGRCAARILPGEQYYYFSVGFRGQKQYRCNLHHPRGSELCGSKMAGVYAANESIEDAMGKGPGALADAIECAVSDVESVRDEYQEGFDNMGDNLQQAESGQAVEEKISGLDDYVNEMNDAASALRDMEPEETESENAEEGDEAADPDISHEIIQQADDQAQELLDGFSL